jgi:hypothetical protein
MSQSLMEAPAKTAATWGVSQYLSASRRHQGRYGEAAIRAVPNSTYATSANLGRFGLQAWANWQPLQAHPRTG